MTLTSSKQDQYNAVAARDAEVIAKADTDRGCNWIIAERQYDQWAGLSRVSVQMLNAGTKAAWMAAWGRTKGR